MGGDYRNAVKALHAAVADLQFKLRQAEIKAAEAGQAPRATVSYPLSNEQMALRLYSIRLSHDDAVRPAGTRYASTPVDDQHAAELRRGYAGQASDEELRYLVGVPIDYFRSRGHTNALFGTLEWRKLAIALCAAEYEALARVAERDEGIFTGQPEHPTLTTAQPVVPDLPPVSLLGLFDDYISSRKLLDKGSESERRWSPVFQDLRTFLKHDDARRMSKQDILKWRDKLLKTKSPKTVRDVWLASLRTVLNWAVREDRLPSNVAADVRQDVPKKRQVRERGFTDDEAARLLDAALSYKRSEREGEKLAAAKRWVPILAAFTGARVTELTQLRKEDVIRKGDRWVIRITPDAGSVKTNQFRDVPLHSQVIELGFDKFVTSSPSGPLFYDASTAKDALSGARTVSGRISTWLRDTGLVPEGVQPSHGWRHRFKTLGRELGYSDRVVDAICGHAGRTAGDSYGDITLAAKQRVIDALRPYSLSKLSETQS
ncbi:site-specific integrase [Tabrizicola sp. M-4]|uniref:site-specific integrase n=1 Tax=Tabrizicola sp. M-4 TaxID=3055847 RepID=UPI003DA95CB3